MATRIYIFGEASLWSCHRLSSSVYDLERDLEIFLQGRGEVIWDNDDNKGAQWNVDLLLDDDADIDGWIGRLTAFLQEWGVSDRTLSFTIIREETPAKWEFRRVEVPER